MRRAIKGFLVARTQGVNENHQKQSDEVENPRRLGETRQPFVCIRHGIASTQVGLVVIELEIDQRAEHLQIGDERIGLRDLAGA